MRKNQSSKIITSRKDSQRKTIDQTKVTGQQDDVDSESQKSDETWKKFDMNNDAEAQAEKFMREYEERQTLSQNLSQRFDKMELDNESSGVKKVDQPKHSIGQMTMSNQQSRFRNMVKNNNSQSQNQMSILNDDN